MTRGRLSPQRKVPSFTQVVCADGRVSHRVDESSPHRQNLQSACWTEGSEAQFDACGAGRCEAEVPDVCFAELSGFEYERLVSLFFKTKTDCGSVSHVFSSQDTFDGRYTLRCLANL